MFPSAPTRVRRWSDAGATRPPADPSLATGHRPHVHSRHRHRFRRGLHRPRPPQWGHDVVVYGLFGGRPGQSAFPDIENAKDILARTSGSGFGSSWETSATATTSAAPSRSMA